jgi:hypothetical protein
MKLRINQDAPKKAVLEYNAIPNSVILFLKETYSKDSIFEILKYFILYLREEKKINHYNWYLEDLNELKLSINHLSNKKIKINERLDQFVTKEFEKLLQENIDTFFILDENRELFENIGSNYQQYNKIINEVIETLKKIEEEEKENEFLLEIDLSEKEEIIVEEKKIKKKKKKKKKLLPTHEWKDTAIRFREENGKWGKWVDIKGKDGKVAKDSGGGGIGKNKVIQLINDALATFSSSGGASFGSGPIANINPSAGSIGTSSFAARQDHNHFHGLLTGTQLHATATISGSGFMSADDKIQLSMYPTTSSLVTIDLITYVEYSGFV